MSTRHSPVLLTWGCAPHLGPGSSPGGQTCHPGAGPLTRGPDLSSGGPTSHLGLDLSPRAGLLTWGWTSHLGDGFFTWGLDFPAGAGVHLGSLGAGDLHFYRRLR